MIGRAHCKEINEGEGDTRETQPSKLSKKKGNKLRL